jgi:hypothetical protein
VQAAAPPCLVQPNDGEPEMRARRSVAGWIVQFNIHRLLPQLVFGRDGGHRKKCAVYGKRSEAGSARLILRFSAKDCV